MRVPRFQFYFIIIPLLILHSCKPDQEQEPMAPDTYAVNKIQTSILIDGKGSDPNWKEAELLTDFRFPWQNRPAPLTEFRALHNGEDLFFQFSVKDDDIVLGNDSTEKRAALGSDRVELFFSVNDSIKPYYTLEIDPRGYIFSAKANFYRQVDMSWDWPGLIAIGSIQDDGYILEGKMPLQSFTNLDLWQDEEKTKLMAGVFRAEFEHAEDGRVKHNWISWIQPDSPEPDFHIPSAFGKWVLR